MLIALTHNVVVRQTEEEAEFDRPETIGQISEALRALGHRVELVEVTGPATRTVSILESHAPDLVFNLAEGRVARIREAIFPGLCEQLGIPFTASDAHTCTVALDKTLTKLVAKEHGIPTAQGMLILPGEKVNTHLLRYPVIVKPNFEGSSKGIHEDAVVLDPEHLPEKVADLLEIYPAGVMVEELVLGRDISVCFLEGAPHGGLLPPVWYQGQQFTTAGEAHVLNYRKKMRVELPPAVAELPADAVPTLRRFAATLIAALRLKGFARLEFRLTPDGSWVLIEVDALPSLDAQADFLVAAGAGGFPDLQSVVSKIVSSACARYGISSHGQKNRSKSAPLRVGLTFNLKRKKAKNAADDDSQAEYDSRETIDAIKNAILSFGHEVVELEATVELPTILPVANVDLVFNIAEGVRGRNRESQVPALLELHDIPYVGSDAAALSITLDKALAKKVVSQAGVSVARYFVMTTGKEKIPKDFQFPAIVKPVAEGSSKGVTGTSVVPDEVSLRQLAKEIVGRYQQGALVEEFLVGREFTVGLLGEVRPKVLPPMEIVFLDKNKVFPVYTFEHKLAFSQEIRYDTPAVLDAPLLKEIERVARLCFGALGCRDVARIDFRMDAAGRVNFIECNPLPGLTPNWSDLCLIAKSAGMDYRTLIAEIMAPAVRRFREKQRKELVKKS